MAFHTGMAFLYSHCERGQQTALCIFHTQRMKKRRNAELMTLSVIHGSLFTLKLYPNPQPPMIWRSFLSAAYALNIRQTGDNMAFHTGMSFLYSHCERGQQTALCIFHTQRMKKRRNAELIYIYICIIYIIFFQSRCN